MSKVFEVTDHGLQIDKVAIKPGSALVVGRIPPAHWSRFGTLHDMPDVVFDPSSELDLSVDGEGSTDLDLTVATPTAKTEAGEDATKPADAAATKTEADKTSEKKPEPAAKAEKPKGKNG